MHKQRREFPHALYLILSLIFLLFIFPKISYAEVITAKFKTSNGSGRVYGPIDVDWNIVHDATSGWADNFIRVWTVWNTNYVPRYRIQRGFIPIDTTSIPENAKILSAKFYIYVTQKYDDEYKSEEYSYITLVESTQVSTSTLYEDDFDNCGEIFSPIEGVDVSDRIDITNIIENDFILFNLNATGISWINNGGWTKFGLREGHDIEDIPISTSTHFITSGIDIYSVNQPNLNYHPYLEITYEVLDEPGEGFSVVHLTDVHLGSNWVPGSYRWYEEVAYPRFTDTLFKVGKLIEQPEMIVVSGDLVEYSKDVWFDDFQSLTDSFSAQTNIPVYVVAGNHDRYLDGTGSVKCGILGLPSVFCDDELANYYEFINYPSNLAVNYLVPGNTANYWYEYNGYMFIGLDSGADYLPDYEMHDAQDQGPESEGLTAELIDALNGLATATPKIVFMHSPVMSGTFDACPGPDCPLEDASFVNFRDEFINFATLSNVDLILTGHTHEAHVFDSDDTEYLTIPEDIRPLFIQTPSVTKDSDGYKHGYRIININNGTTSPEEASETGVYQKKVAQLFTGDKLKLKYYDPINFSNFVTPVSLAGLSIPFFTASGSRRVIVYDSVASNTKLRIVGEDSFDKEYDLEVRQEEVGIPKNKNRRARGFYLRNFDLAFISGHIEAKNNLAKLWLKDVELENTDEHQLLVNWTEFINNRGKDGVELGFDIDNDGVFDEGPEVEYIPDSISVDLDSPGELQVIDMDDNITGLVNHERMEEIPFSLYENVEERVTVYLKDGFDNQQFYYQVHGLENVFGDAKDTYTLTIYLDQDEASTSFKAIDIPILASTTHRYVIDWEVLMAGGNGAQLLIDGSGDGIFEQTLYSDEVLTAEECAVYLPFWLKLMTRETLLTVTTGDERVDEKIMIVIDYIDASLADEFWADELHLNPDNGEKVFLNEAQAVIRLQNYLHLDDKSKQHALPSAVVDVFEQAITNLVKADRVLAQVAWYEHQMGMGDTQKDKSLVKWVENKLESVLDNETDNPLTAINFYRQVWEKLN